MTAPAGPPLHMPLRPVTAHPMKPPVHIPPSSAGPRIMSAPATLSQGYHPFPRGPEPARGPHEFIDLTKAEPLPPIPDPIPRHGQSSSASISPSMSPGSFKRSSSVLGTPATPEVSLKRFRIESFDQSTPDNRAANNFPPPDPDLKPETDSANDVAQVTPPHPRAPSASPSAAVDQKGDQPTSLSDKDLRPDEECVRMIFEKDAQVENGVFCDPCLYVWPLPHLLECSLLYLGVVTRQACSRNRRKFLSTHFPTPL
ncbi:hypothetical protein EDD17DRAFT_513825 [Pisolithus thermaeus]|nr:hypothetical protein EDD17DRAFT_513825 [Pisolithus thermaeus]